MEKKEWLHYPKWIEAIKEEEGKGKNTPQGQDKASKSQGHPRNMGQK